MLLCSVWAELFWGLDSADILFISLSAVTVESDAERVPGVDLVRHHDMLWRVLDHAPQRVLHPSVEAALVLRRCFLALTGFP